MSQEKFGYSLFTKLPRITVAHNFSLIHKITENNCRSQIRLFIKLPRIIVVHNFSFIQKITENNCRSQLFAYSQNLSEFIATQ